jgi:hypothetical protein
MMKLRDHPQMDDRPFPNWPPVWTLSRKEQVKTIRGEFGTLVYVYANDLVSNKVYLVIDYQQESYVGCLVFEDRAFCAQIIKVLRQQIGRAVSEIGELELPDQL